MNEEFRYLFTVRQRFGEEPKVDNFYKLVSPSGMSSDQIKVMKTLKPGWEEESLKEDTTAFSCMTLRLRCNSDMFQNVCLVRTSVEITAEDLDLIIQQRHRNGSLQEFLKNAAV